MHESFFHTLNIADDQNLFIMRDCIVILRSFNSQQAASNAEVLFFKNKCQLLPREE